MSADPVPLSALGSLEWEGSPDGGQAGAATSAMAAVALSSLLGGGDIQRETALRAFHTAGDGSARTLYLSIERLLAGALAAGASEAAVVRAAERLGARASDAAALAASLPAARLRAGAAARTGAAAAIASETLTDFNWSVEHVAASNGLRALGEARLTLRIDVGSRPPALAELALPELDALIAELERALGAPASALASAAVAQHQLPPDLPRR